MEDEKMDELLLEANKMLRMMKEKETSEAKMNKLHQQLDEIKRSIKTLKLTRVREAKCSATEEESYGLFDLWWLRIASRASRRLVLLWQMAKTPPC